MLSLKTWKCMAARVAAVWLSAQVVGMCWAADDDAVAPAKSVDYRLQDFLNRTWRNEFISFPLIKTQAAHVKAGHALKDSKGTAVAYQVFSEDKTTRIAFLTDLEPFETRTFAFAESPASKETDLVVKDGKDMVVLGNSLTGVRLRKKLTPGKGPIAGIRLNSGRWVIDTDLHASAPPSACALEITAKGPVFSEAIYYVVFEKDTHFTLRLRLYAREPVILIDENFNVPGNNTHWALNLDRDFSPDTLLYRDGHDRNRPSVWTMAGDDVWLLRPWTLWWERDRAGPCFSLFRVAPAVACKPPQSTDGKETPELLTIAAREASTWIDPQVPREQRMPAYTEAKRYGGVGNVLWLPMHLWNRGTRKWMIAALPAKEGLTLAKGEKLPAKSVILPDQYMIKHSHFPLDRVKDYALQWPHAQDAYPCLFVKKADLPALRKATGIPEAFATRMAGFRTDRLSQFGLDGDITATAAFLLTGDQDIAHNVAESCLMHLQTAVDVFLKQDVMTYGSAPHVTREFVVPALGMADVALADEQLPADKRQRLLAQLAFLGYVYSDPNYWSPERGFKATANMTTTVNWLNLMIACLVPSQPKAKEWAAKALQEFHDELHDWPDENGGWLESPHYSGGSYDQLLASLLMARNAGFSDEVFDPRMKKGAEWFAKISTPPDSRLSGRRHLPPVGNTYLQEPTGLFGTVATVWKDKDPVFASQMRWMFEQHGSPLTGMGLIGCFGLFRGAGIAPQAPAYGSELFPKSGAVLRHGFPSDRETYLYLVAGANHEHYDNDSGSFVFWGQGRVLGDDFGYCGCAPEDDQSMVSTGGAGGIMEVKEFRASPGVDYVRGVKGPWTRQIALVKPPAPQGPAYFMVADTLAAPAPYIWRLWLAARDIALGKDLATMPVSAKTGTAVEEDGTAMDPAFVKPMAASRAWMAGREDVDLDVFVLSPAKPMLRTQRKTLQSLMGYGPDGKQISNYKVTQIGLIAEEKQGSGLTVILYPRLKTVAPPSVTVIAGGRGAKVKRGADTDYVFLSPAPITFKEGTLSFQGTSGVAQMRGGKRSVYLGAPGKIAYGSVHLERK